MAAGQRRQPVSTVIFDLGGVLIDWDPRHLYRKLFVDDEPGMERFLAEVTTAAWNLSLDAGKPFAEAVAELIAKHPAERARIEAYHGRWIEMISGPIRGTVEILEDLAGRGVPLYAITNWASETFEIVRRDPAYAFLDLFREIYVSGELGMVKPEPAIFRHALARIGAEPGACLFVDDNARNVEAAAALGLAAHRFTTPEALATDLRDLGLLG
jgi:2-haloacid dehalogenase